MKMERREHLITKIRNKVNSKVKKDYTMNCYMPQNGQ